MFLLKRINISFIQKNKDFNSIEFVNLRCNQVITSRKSNFKTLKTHNTRVGLNSLANIFYLMNDLIPLKWLNVSNDSYKVQCKKVFLKCENV